MQLSRSLSGAVAAAAAVFLALAGPTAAQAQTLVDHTTSTPTAGARSAGVQPGNAYMGWAQHTPSARAAQQRMVIDTDPAATSYPHGIDVASYQGNVDWKAQYSAGKRFAYVKATENTNYQNPYFTQQYDGSYKVGMIRGAYHFAIPNGPSGASQADYFVAHGGGWSKDGKTLPGMLDIEYNPYGSTCYGISQASMRSWITSFINEYHAKTTRWATIYTTNGWWTQCTGNSTAYHDNDPLDVACYCSSAGTLPGGWPFYTFWQYSSSPIDQDVFSASQTQLVKLATG